ncbi:hypothetical protein A0J61_07985 [Choanephora cucurbitarum]|uniref:Uncharacterized protein n=1 Tax=Choanephora cucurbitarum TaxID=101091 RepID=A0A1C7N4L5_9FUNG|nr:hypothetical protein A0J61_07985 [Choanephora cucurbitarum]
MATAVKNLVVFGDFNPDHPNWSEYLALGWNASLYSFAFSGSVCDHNLYGSTSDIPSLKDQLEAYYTLRLNLKPEETVYAFWIGTQDVLDMGRHVGKANCEITQAIIKRTHLMIGQHEIDVKKVTDCIVQQLKAALKVFLSDRFLVFNIPPIEYMPLKSTSALNQSQAAVEINRGLERDVANLNKHHYALKMDYMDIHSLVHDIVADPALFQLTEPPYLDRCSGQKQCGSGEHDGLRWDKTQFTLGFHQKVAEGILEAESYMPKIELTEEWMEQLNDPQSRFHSKKYKVRPAKGIVDEQARLYDMEKSSPIQPQQPPLEDEPEMVAAKSHVHLIGLLALLLVFVGIVWVKSSCLLSFFSRMRNNDRGKFTPVRNEEV